MIPVARVEEPTWFDAEVRRLGLGALRELIGMDPSGAEQAGDAPKRRGRKRERVADRFEDIPAEKLKPLWDLAHWTIALGAREGRDDPRSLRRAYHNRCAYLGMRILPSKGGTVDHFQPKDRDRALAYEWSNFRLAVSQVNSKKGQQAVIDPFTVPVDWFILLIGTFKVEPNPDRSVEERAQIQATINALGLNDTDYCLDRGDYHDRYLGLGQDERDEPRQPLPFQWLEAECPFVAAELARRGLLRPEDQAAGARLLADLDRIVQAERARAAAALLVDDGEDDGDDDVDPDLPED